MTEYLRRVSARIDSGEIDCSRIESMRDIIDGYVDLIGIDVIRGWSPEYTYGTRVKDPHRLQPRLRRQQPRRRMPTRAGSNDGWPRLTPSDKTLCSPAWYGASLFC